MIVTLKYENIKKCSIVLALLIIFPFMLNKNCLAKSFAKSSDRMIYVYGEMDSSYQGKEVSLLLLDRDADLSTITQTDVKHIEQCEIDASGKYAISFKCGDDIVPTNCNLYARVGTQDVTNTIITANMEESDLFSYDVSISQNTATTTATVIFTNIFGEPESNIEYTPMLAFYDGDGRLVGVNIGNKNQQVLSASKPDGTKTIKAFAWKNAICAIPLCSNEVAVNDENFTLHLVGDSLVMNYMGLANYFPQTGWGQMIGAYLKDNVTVNNTARGGWSIKAFLTYKQPYASNINSVWDENILSNIKQGDYVLISSMANEKFQTYYDKYEDGNLVYTFKAKCGSEINGTYIYDEYENSLKEVIDDIKEKGATPILVSAPTSMTVSENTLQSALSEYVNAMSKVAQIENVTFVDFTKIQKAVYEEIGYTNAKNTYHMTLVAVNRYKEIYTDPAITWSTKTTDDMHLNIEGADMVASTIADLILRSNSGLKQYIKSKTPYFVNFNNYYEN